MGISHSLLFDHDSQATQVIIPSGRTTYVNRAWQKLWDVPDAALNEVFFGNYNILLDPLMLQLGLGESIERAFNGEFITTEPIMYDPKKIGFPGRERKVVAQFEPVLNSHSELIEIIIYFQDITPLSDK